MRVLDNVDEVCGKYSARIRQTEGVIYIMQRTLPIAFIMLKLLVKPTSITTLSDSILISSNVQ